jgi:hypothetical protein
MPLPPQHHLAAIVTLLAGGRKTLDDGTGRGRHGTRWRVALLRASKEG